MTALAWICYAAGLAVGSALAWLLMHRRTDALAMEVEAGIRERQRMEATLQAWRQEAVCLRARLDGQCDPNHPRDCGCLQAMIGRPRRPMGTQRPQRGMESAEKREGGRHDR